MAVVHTEFRSNNRLGGVYANWGPIQATDVVNASKELRSSLMRPIGFSTGALAYSDFGRGVQMVSRKEIRYIELSALRQEELPPLFRGIGQLDLSGFSYISIHAPSRIDPNEEAAVVDMLQSMSFRGWPVILHPDAVHDFSLWRKIG